MKPYKLKGLFETVRPLPDRFLPIFTTACSVPNNKYQLDGNLFDALNAEPHCYNSSQSPTRQPAQRRNWMIDYYEFLQISPHADNETIHRVYRYLAGRLHPDN